MTRPTSSETCQQIRRGHVAVIPSNPFAHSRANRAPLAVIPSPTASYNSQIRTARDHAQQSTDLDKAASAPPSSRTHK